MPRTPGAKGVVGAPVEVTANQPEDFGLLGWTSDPLQATSTATTSLGSVNLVRWRCTKSGLVGHVGYLVTVIGTVLTAGQNFIGLYDTGESVPGQATQLGITGDQTANFGAAAVALPALVVPALVQAGQDYFWGILANGTTAPTLERASSGALALWNQGLAGLGVRTGTSGAGLTALPASIAAGAIAGGGASFVLTAAA